MSTESNPLPSESLLTCTLAARRVVGARGRVEGGHIWGAERTIAVTSGELTLRHDPATRQLVVEVSLEGLVSGWVNRGGGGYGLHFAWELAAADFLETLPDAAPTLRDGASGDDERRGRKGRYSRGVLALEARQALEAPSMTGRSYPVDRRQFLSIEVSSDFRRIGAVRVRETTSPWLLVAPLNLVVVRVPFPRVVTMTDATLTLVDA